ncbi:MAG: NIF family HAD-type phosphatase [Candidatus Woesearchaeota archaeon]
MNQDFNILRALKLKKKKNWDFIYVAIDLHGTIIPEREANEENFEMFPKAKKVLQELSKKEYIKLILFTASTKEYIKKFLDKIKDEEIKFDYINENPEALETTRESFCADSKLYYNVLLDDRAGFEPKDWEYLAELITSGKI